MRFVKMALSLFAVFAILIGLLCSCGKVPEQESSASSDTHQTASSSVETVPSETQSSFYELTTKVFEYGLGYSPPAYPQPIYVLKMNEFFDDIENRIILENYPESVSESYNYMFDRLQYLDVIPYPTIDGTPISSENMNYTAFFLPEAKYEDIGIEYPFVYGNRTYLLMIYTYKYVFEDEFDKGLIDYFEARFADSDVIDEEHQVKICFEEKEYNAYYVNEYYEFTTDLCKTIKGYQNLVYFKKNDFYIRLTVAASDIEGTNYLELVDLIENHLGLVDVYSLKEQF